VNIPESHGHLSDVRPEYILLGFLQRESMHGYDLLRRYQARLGRVWKLSQSQLYSILKRLESRGFIAAVSEIAQEEASSRRIYTTTPLGTEHFRSWLATPTDTSSRILRLEFISRLCFAKDYGADIATLVRFQRAAVERSLLKHEEILKATAPEDTYNRLSVEFRLAQLRCVLSWIDQSVIAKFALPEGENLGRANNPS